MTDSHSYHNVRTRAATRRYWWVVLGLFAVFAIIGYASGPFTVVSDGIEYVTMAQHLLHAGAFTYDGVHPVVGKPPGFSFLLAAYLAVFGSLDGFRIVQLVLLFSSFLFVAESLRLFGRPGLALASLALLSGAWPLHVITAHPFSEPLFFALVSFGLYALLRTFQRPRAPWIILTGIVFALATYVRPVTIVWPFVLLVAILIGRRQRWRMGVAIVAVFLVVVAPWIVRTYRITGRVVPMVANYAPLYYMSDEALWQVYYFEGSRAVRGKEDYLAITDGEFQFNWEPNRRFAELAYANIGAHFPPYIGRCFRQMAFAWTYLPRTKEWHERSPGLFQLGRVVMAGFYALTVFGLIVLWRRHREFVLISVAFTASTALVLFPVCTESRYLLPAYMWLLPATIVGVATIFERGRARVISGRRASPSDA